MAKLRCFNRLVADYGALADFLIVYIQEAHPSDGWAFRNNPFNIRHHRSLEDRLNAARRLLQAEPACPVIVDNMKDEANFQYGAVPERLYIILDSQIVYAGGKGPHGYKLDEVQHWLAAHARKVQNESR